jgi:DNA polymerase-1
MVDRSKLEFEPDEKVFLYNNLDTKFAMRLYQDREPKMEGMEKARELFTEGQKIFPEMEVKGVRIDTVELGKQDKKFSAMIEKVKNGIINSQEGLEFKKIVGRGINIAKKVSTLDMKKLLFEIMGVEVKHRTEKGNPSLTEKTLEEYTDEVPICKDIIRLNKLTHHKSTYIDGIKKRLIEDRVHPSGNLHLVDTFRSSYDDPNLQNFPIRDPELKVIRKIILPDEGYILGEVDYKGIEVCVAAMFSKDPVLIDYLETGYDMHTDWGNRLFQVDRCNKEQRYTAKNGWVFPQFYGSYYGSILKRFEKEESFRKLFKCQGRNAFDWYGAEEFLKEQEEEFWDIFKVFKEWKNNQVKFYEENRYVETFWGFRRPAPLSRNRIINTPIQGHAFHLLLDSMIRFIKEMKKRKMKSRVMFEVHDSCIFSIYPPEKEELVELVTDAMCNMKYDFINVPLKVEWEFSDTNWYDIKED